MSNLTLFFMGQMASGFAFELFHSATAYYILTVTGSPTKFAFAFILDNLPKMLFLQVAGQVVDKFNRKLVFIMIDVIQAMFLFSVFYYFSFYGVTVNILLFFTFIAGLLKAFTYPATKAIVPILAKDRNRMKASSFEISNDKIARTLAPVISILFFAKYGIKFAVLFTGLVYSFAAFVKIFLQVENIVLPKQKLSTSIADGFRSLFKSKFVVYAWINSVITQFIFHPFLAQVIPNLIKKTSDNASLNYVLKAIVTFLGRDREDVYLSLVAIIGLANAFGAIASLMLFQFKKREIDWKKGMKFTTMLLIPSSVVISLAILYLGLDSSANAVTITYVLFPISMIFYFILNTYTVFFTFFYQENVPKEGMGRFVANLMSIFMLTKMIGHYLYGRMLESGFIYPVIILLLASLAKLLVFNKFEKELEKVE